MYRAASDQVEIIIAEHNLARHVTGTNVAIGVRFFVRPLRHVEESAGSIARDPFAPRGRACVRAFSTRLSALERKTDAPRGFVGTGGRRTEVVNGCG